MRLIAFDTEDNTDGAPEGFLCAAFYSKEEGSFTFTSREQARKYMFKKRKGRTIFAAHNLAYDLTNLDYPENSIRIMPLKGGGISCGIHKSDRYIDTLNFYHGNSVASLATMVGMRKLDFKIDLIKHKRFSGLNRETQENLLEYCLNDAIIVYKAAEKIFEIAKRHGITSDFYTTAGLAIKMFPKYWKGKFKRRPLEVSEYEREACYGGRTEIFNYTPQRKVVYEDIVSCYPSVMKNEIFPDPRVYEIRNEDSILNLDYEGISTVTLEVPNSPKLQIPPLPHRITRGKKAHLIFPIGTWTGTYTHPELRMAMKRGVIIKKIHKSIVYPVTCRPFVKFVDNFYRLKQKSRGVERELYKNILNRLPGKFAERRYEVMRGKFKDLLPKMIDSPVIPSPNKDGWVNFTGERKKDPIHAVPIWNAYVASYGRIKLYEERLTQIPVLYCDTDCCISRYSISWRVGTSLGMWKRKFIHSFLVNAPKDYILYGERVLKGIGKDAKRRGDKYIVERPLKVAEAIKRNGKPNQWITEEKMMFYDFDKRHRNDDGTTEPLEVREGEIA
jgi:hypothetical protein